MFAVFAPIFVLLITLPKLYKMCQIRGWLAGAHEKMVVITQKWVMKNNSILKRDSYWIAWTEKDIREVGAHRINLQAEKWKKLKVGDRVKIVTVPEDRHPYLQDGIFVSVGNFILDIVIFFAGISYPVYFFFKTSHPIA
ncbi:hypothetical protein ACFL35_04060 [Candidatus Riflebacteria bacterium]